VVATPKTTSADNLRVCPRIDYAREAGEIGSMVSGAKRRVLVTSTFLRPGDEVDRRLQEAGLETIFNPMHGGRTEEEMIALLARADAAIASGDPFTARVLESADRLKVIARTAVGFDTIDVGIATARGIAVCTSAGANRCAVAEYTIAMMLQCARKLVENLTEARKGGWTRHEGTDLAGSTLGIVGLGNIGKEVARRARAFDMRIVAHDTLEDATFAEQYEISYLPLEELLRESDYVTLHVSLDSRSRHLLNAERLALMKPTAFLINMARGAIVDTTALWLVLKEKRLAAAVLDVFEHEPLEADSPLRGLDNIYLSPHVAAVTAGARRASGRMAVENVVRVLRGEPPLHIVNPEVLG